MVLIPYPPSVEVETNTNHIISYPSSLGTSPTFTKEMWVAAGSPNDFELGDGYTDIGNLAFAQTAITSITIPASVETIGIQSFFECTSLTTVTFSANSTLKTIGENAFSRSALTSIAIPASVETIGEAAFNDCSNLTSVTFIPSTNTDLGITLDITPEDANMFTNTPLTDVYMAIGQVIRVAGNSISILPETIGQTAPFLGSSTTPTLKMYIPFLGIRYMWLIAGSPTEVELGDGWTKIDNYEFALAQTAITSITIPASVTSIGNYAFVETALASIVIPASVTSIGIGAFGRCSSLTAVNFAANSTLRTIGEGAFAASAITSITIPASVTSIESGAFYNCSNLTSVTFIPSTNSDDGITIGENAFNLTALVRVIINDNNQIFRDSSTNAIFSIGTIGSFFGSPETTAIPRMPSCFPAGTPVQTDQGVTAIDKLVPGEHTLRGKSIIAITQTRPLQKHIVCFEKDSIGKNVPSQQTLCSKEHKVLYRGEMIKARDLADMCKNVKKVSYNGETLYNVLLEKHGKMLVNNMICETLHPENIAAKFAKSKNSPSKRAIA